MTALKSLLFLVLAPGLVAGYIPLVLLREGPRVETGPFAYLAFPLWLIGSLVLLWCFRENLVVTGLYCYVRNPMYVGVLTIVIGHFLWFKTIWMIGYAVLVFVAFYSFVTLYEEPHLRETFGAVYEDYCKRVPRWIPKFT